MEVNTFQRKLKQNTFPKQIVDWLITTSKENGYWFSASHSFKRQMDSNNVQFVFQCWRLHKISNEFYFILNCLLVLNNILRKAMRSVIFKRIYKHNCIITVKKSVTFEVACSLHFKLQPIILKIAENNDCENFCSDINEGISSQRKPEKSLNVGNFCGGFLLLNEVLNFKKPLKQIMKCS
jgi:hypothetical protein